MRCGYDLFAVVRLDGSQPVRYGLKLEMDDKYRSLKQSLSDLCGISGSRLLLVEVYGAMIRVCTGYGCGCGLKVMTNGS